MPHGAADVDDVVLDQHADGAAVIAGDRLAGAAGAGVHVVAGDAPADHALGLDVVGVVGAAVAEVVEDVVEDVHPGAGADVDAVEVAVGDVPVSDGDAGVRAAGRRPDEDLGVGPPLLGPTIQSWVLWSSRMLDLLPLMSIVLVKAELRIVMSRAPLAIAPLMPVMPRPTSTATAAVDANAARAQTARREHAGTAEGTMARAIAPKDRNIEDEPPGRRNGIAARRGRCAPAVLAATVSTARERVVRRSGHIHIAPGRLTSRPPAGACFPGLASG
jgi:hypothetical protein